MPRSAVLCIMGNTRTVSRNLNATAHAAGVIWLTRLALVLAIALVVCRCTLTESLHDSLMPVPNAPAVPRRTGAATGAVMDLLCCLPALLVLGRWVVDRSFALRWRYSHLLLGLLAIWACISVAWSSDRFAAAVYASHLLVAAIVLWAATQLIRSWRDLRLLGAVLLGVLLIFIAYAVFYRGIDLPDLKREWEQNRTQILQQQGAAPGSFLARQLENKILHGDVSGFTASPNTYAAATVLLMAVAMGWIAQRRADGDLPAILLLPLAAIAGGVWIVDLTDSKTAFVTSVAALGILVLLRPLRPWLARHTRLGYALGVAIVLAVLGGVIGLGLAHGSLPTRSLAFRWQYWIGAARLFVHHLWLGVGWGNFANPYLAYRSAAAPEEISDPHNLLVKAMVELGIVGLTLMAGWLASLWWDLTRPHTPPDALPADAAASPTASDRLRRGDRAVRADRVPALPTVGTITAIALGFSVLGGIDFGQSTAYVLLQLLRSFVYFVAFFLGTVALVLPSTTEPSIDERPAPWLLYGMMVGVGLFLVHNLIDFSLFDPSTGPLFLFAIVVGGMLGARQPPPHRSAAPAGAGAARMLVLAVAVAAWLAVAMLWVAPMVTAENHAAAGTTAITRARFVDAAREYQAAFADAPVTNSDYLRGAFIAMSYGNAPPDDVRRVLATAIAANPASIELHVLRAQYAQQGPAPDFPQALADLAWSVAHKPSDAELHLRYADALLHEHQDAQALEQYRLTLAFNDRLPPDEPRRLSPDLLQHAADAIAQLQQHR